MSSERSKPKGNSYERKVAKQMSFWMFNSPNILYRHEDSGARKVVYTGDIIPKDADHFYWPFYPFVMEAKNGYEDHIPTIMNQTFLRKWIVKLLSERTDTQRIPFLICQFHHQIPILLTNITLNAPSDIAVFQEYNSAIETFFVYKFNELLKMNFLRVMPDWFKDVITHMIISEEPTPVQDVKSINIQTQIKRNKKEEKDAAIGAIVDQILFN